MEDERILRFFIFGDIGHDGPCRSMVANAAVAMQEKWKTQKDEPLAQFVLTTGDNIYGSADDSAFDSLQKEMMDKLPLPWYFCLGNHDVKHEKYEWHRSKDGIKGKEGWSWHCPAPAYTLPESITMNLIDLHVINTNKLSKVKPTNPPGPAADFYTSNTSRWWREQKESLNDKLQKGNTRNDNKVVENSSFNRWQVVVGHHPAEYVYLSMKEHGLWGIRYFPTTFMRGNPKNMIDREGLAHMLRKGADLYICGHQHISAYMKLSNYGKHRPKEEQRCLFAIVGNSSKLDQDEGDFDDDFFGGKAYQIEEEIAKKHIARTESYANEVFTEEVTNSSNNTVPTTGTRLTVPRRPRTLSIPQNRRYLKEWSQAHTFGFAFAHVTTNCFKITFMEVYADGGFRESKSIEL